MGRTPGARNRDYERTRDEFASRMADHVVARRSVDPPTMAELAAAAGVTPPTLRHYFVDLDGALRAALEATGRAADRHLAAVADPGDADVAASVHGLVRLTVRAWRDHGVGAVMAAGMGLGLSRQPLGATYLSAQLDPVVAAAARRLQVHVDRGELPDTDTRAAALGLLAPVLVALLHQDHLGGRDSSPLDVDAFADHHADVMLAGWGVPTPGVRGRRVPGSGPTGDGPRRRRPRPAGTP